MFVGRYTTRPTQLSVLHQLESDGRKARVYRLNGLLVTVWEDGEVTANREYHSTTDIKQALPNISFDDGEIRLPIEDLVAFILQRITPLELAEGIIADDEARSALIDKLAERYNTPSFSDADRRQFLTKVQQQVYAAAVDRVVGFLNDKERNERSRSDYFRWKGVELGHYRFLYEKMERLLQHDEEKLSSFKYQHPDPQRLDEMIKYFRWKGVELGHYRFLYEKMERLLQHDEEKLSSFKYQHPDPQRLDEMIKQESDPIRVENVGPQWHESRDYWRRRIEELFTAPEKMEEEK